jgi:hypothetical protein
MNETFYPATGFVMTAIIAWSLYVRGLHRIGNVTLGASLIGLWALCVLNAAPIINAQRPIVHRSLSTLHAAEITNNSQSTVVVSTLDRAKKTYHRPGCQYVGLMVHRIETSESAAIEAGYEPCTKCFPGQIARAK